MLEIGYRGSEIGKIDTQTPDICIRILEKVEQQTYDKRYDQTISGIGSHDP